MGQKYTFRLPTTVQLLQRFNSVVQSKLLANSAFIVTNCTARKCVRGDSLVLDSTIFGRRLIDTVAKWRNAVAETPVKWSATDLYGGRSFSEAVRCSKEAAAPLFVISAGLGVVRDTDRIPLYDVAGTGKDRGLEAVLTRHSINAAEWWIALNRGGGIADLLKGNPCTTLYLALPATYLSLISQDLACASDADLHRLRIFTSIAGRKGLPPRLRSLVLPYDERLETVPGFAGTHSDFAQRALSHCLSELDGLSVDSKEAARRVALALSRRPAPAKFTRARKNDIEVKSALRANWHSFNGSASKLLRYLRDDAQIACEQKRFSLLWHELREEGLDSNGRSASYAG